MKKLMVGLICFGSIISFGQNSNCKICYDQRCTEKFCTTNFYVGEKNIMIKLVPSPYKYLKKSSARFYFNIVMDRDVCYINDIVFFDSISLSQKKSIFNIVRNTRVEVIDTSAQRKLNVTTVNLYPFR